MFLENGTSALCTIIDLPSLSEVVVGVKESGTKCSLADERRELNVVLCSTGATSEKFVLHAKEARAADIQLAATCVLRRKS